MVLTPAAGPFPPACPICGQRRDQCLCPVKQADSLCALCGYLLGNAQHYWLIHDEVAKWLLARDTARAAQLAADLATLPTAFADTADLLALITRAYRALPREVQAQPPF